MRIRKAFRNWWIRGACVFLAVLIGSTVAFVQMTRMRVVAKEALVSITVGGVVTTIGDSYPLTGGETYVEEMPWGYLYHLENGDTVQVGDNETTDFKPYVKTIRWNGVADFSLWLEGGTFVPSLNGTMVSFDFNDDIHVEIYPREPCERLPEGGIEYDITLNSKPAQNRVDFNIDWNGLTWQKVLPLDEEYDQAACEEEWGVEYAPFSINQTNIVSQATGETLKHIEMYEVNSYVGTAVDNYHRSSGDMGGGVSYSTVSRSYLHIHRGLMTDDLGDTAWVENIELDEDKREITFILPKTWLKNAAYPVHQVCGLDPAYTEDMDSFGTGLTEDAWTAYDVSGLGLSIDDVAEFIITNDDSGKEYYGGIRTYGGSEHRVVHLHEAEGGGCTSVRMFVLVGDDSSTPTIEYYTDENTDIIFTVVGYWQNVGYTELWDSWTGTAGSWQEDTVSGSPANRVLSVILVASGLGNAAETLGTRETSSATERKVLVHEMEGGGGSHIDMITKTDADGKVDVYRTVNIGSVIYYAGYFGAELDFVELFSTYPGANVYWGTVDISADLDQDGRVTDWLLTHSCIDTEHYLGVRDGDDSSTARYIQEHEAEDNGSSTGELTGFGLSAKSDSDGHVYTFGCAGDLFKLMGYFKPTAVGTVDISVSPTSYDFGTVVESSTTNTTTGNFTLTNLSDVQTDQTISCQSTWSGGLGWNHSDAGTAGDNTTAIYAYRTAWDIIVKNASPNYLYENCPASTNYTFGLSLQAPTVFYDGAEKSNIITITATQG